MRETVGDVLVSFDVAVLVYFVVLNTFYFFLVVLAAIELRRADQHEGIAGFDEMFANPLTPSVSVILPAHDEEPVIVESVRAMLRLKYPHVQVIVVDDGSTDRTFEVLREAFDLVEVPLVIPDLVPVREEVESSWIPRDGVPLLVLRKQAGGQKSDPLNAGINAASGDLVCLVDADAVLDEEALLRAAKPFVDDPLRTVATGGTIRAANGSTFYRGRLVEARMPKSWVTRIQVVEYLRGFLVGRVGWSRLRSLVVISGAFGLFRRDVVVEAGGMAHDTIGEDAELAVRIHRQLSERGMDYRVHFVPDAVCWTEVPSSLQILGRQRRRWGRGLCEVLWRHRRMMGNPRYGRIGTLAMPYQLLFEVLGPVVELLGFLTALLGFAFGLIDAEFAALFFAVALGYGILLSFASIVVEEFAFHRYPRWRDLGVALAVAVVENFGYRQLHAWWRLRGLGAFLRGGQAQWGVMTRTGFAGVETEKEPIL